MTKNAWCYGWDPHKKEWYIMLFIQKKETASCTLRRFYVTNGKPVRPKVVTRKGGFHEAFVEYVKAPHFNIPIPPLPPTVKECNDGLAEEVLAKVVKQIIDWVVKQPPVY